jgi:hypothetical protein
MPAFRCGRFGVFVALPLPVRSAISSLAKAQDSFRLRAFHFPVFYSSFVL